VGKVGKPDNNLGSDAQGLADDTINFFYFLHALIQNYIIKRIVRKFAQAVFDVIMKYA